MSHSSPIITLGNPILQQVAEPVDHPEDKHLQSLIDDLIKICCQSNGVGIAAPQISQSLRLFIVASRPSPRYPDAPLMSPTAMINPKIIAYHQDTVKGWEGCLSVPYWRGLVPRYREITVEYYDRTGQVQHQVLNDFIARIFQHELDHLNGIVFLDRLESSEDLFTEEAYQNLTNSL